MESIRAWRNLKSDSIKSVKDTWNGTRTGFKLLGESMRDVSFDPIMNWAKGVRKSNTILKQSYEDLGARTIELQGLIASSTNTKDIKKYTRQLEDVQKAAAKHPGNLTAEKSKGVGGTVLGAVGGLLGKISPKAILGSIVDKAFKGKGKSEQTDEAADPSGAGKAGAESNGQELAAVAEKYKSLQGQMDEGIGRIALAFAPAFNKLLDFGLKISDKLLPMILTAISPIVEIVNSIPIDAILENVMTIVGAIITAIGPILEQLKPLFDSIIAIMAPLMQDITDFIVVLIEGLAPILQAIAHIVSAVLGPALVVVGKALGWLITIAKWVVKIILAILQPIVFLVAMIMDGIMWLFGQSNKNSGKDTTGKFINPPNPNDTKVTAVEAGAQGEKGLAGDAKTVTTTSKSEQHTSSRSATKTGSEVTSGGPRVINIYGVKFAEKIDLSVINAKEGIHHLEVQLQEMFLRILNSGAVIQ